VGKPENYSFGRPKVRPEDNKKIILWRQTVRMRDGWNWFRFNGTFRPCYHSVRNYYHIFL
jgi:hypothetical protein